MSTWTELVANVAGGRVGGGGNGNGHGVIPQPFGRPITTTPLDAAPLATVDATVAFLMGRIAVQDELIRWLSLPYGDNEPSFAGADGRGTLAGLPLGAAPQLHTLWHQVMGRPHVDELDDPRTWVECETCKRYHVETRLL